MDQMDKASYPRVSRFANKFFDECFAMAELPVEPLPLLTLAAQHFIPALSDLGYTYEEAEQLALDWIRRKLNA